MNGLYLVIISALIFVLAYRFYGAFIAAKVLTVNQYKVTPAFRFEDGHDYVPTNKYVVFGHHFAAIAGAAPWSVRSLRLSSVTCRAPFGSSSVVSSLVPSTTWSSSLPPCAMTGNPSPKSPKRKSATSRPGYILRRLVPQHPGYGRYGRRHRQCPSRQPLGYFHDRHDHSYRYLRRHLHAVPASGPHQRRYHHRCRSYASRRHSRAVRIGFADTGTALHH